MNQFFNAVTLDTTTLKGNRYSEVLFFQILSYGHNTMKGDIQKIIQIHFFPHEAFVGK